MMKTRIRILYALFVLSGFCGLIYESIWSHYLKLFLGHAAYAQTVVLIVFIGGLALGAWLASRVAVRLKRPLIAYAAAEFIVGISALVFHSVFVAGTDWAYMSLLPATCEAQSWCWTQWAFAAMLILPQSILLGTTFPLMTSGILRLDPQMPGGKLSLLYFLNSIGAVAGVLVSGFLLIAMIGLPGALLTAGICNVFLAIAVYRVDKGTQPAASPDFAAGATRDAARDKRMTAMLLAVAMLTGLSSFIYEIAWIRSLSLVLGSATHSFELMLASFILGLALGGLWIRSRIDAIRNPVRFLAIVQIIMGLAAAATLPVYSASFDVMAWVLSAVGRTDAGYVVYLLLATAICLMVMLPATFMAGMTLPLITFHLLRTPSGERSIGQVYATNTLGAILGVIFAVHIALPSVGVKGALIAGAAIDVALGIALLFAVQSGKTISRAAWSSAGVAGIVIAAFSFQLDPLKLASGVFRSGIARFSEKVQVVFHKDGKTATVDVLKDSAGGVSILTNGKSDGAAALDPRIAGARSDEHTMVLAALLPFAHNPKIRDVAVIGYGTGMSASAALSSPAVARVDTIEIEPAMVEGAIHFRPMTDAAYTDPRSHIVIDDAKSYFARSSRRYDLIISEPSNPWVSGVASLYTREFYQRIRGQLNPGGLLAQWIHVYSFNSRLLASVIKALRESFPHFAIYATNTGDVLIIASPVEPLRPLDGAALTQGSVPAWLERLELGGVNELAIRRIADNVTAGMLFASIDVPANSDYFPIVDNFADRARFLNEDATQILVLGNAMLPVTEMLDRQPRLLPHAPAIAKWPTSERGREAQIAEFARRFLMGEASAAQVRSGVSPYLAHLLVFRSQLIDCRNPQDAREIWDAALVTAGLVNVSLPLESSSAIWTRVMRSPCFGSLDADTRRWIELFHAVGRRDAAAMSALAEGLLGERKDVPAGDLEYLYGAAVLGRLAAGDRERARALAAKYDPLLLKARREYPPFTLFRNAAFLATDDAAPLPASGAPRPQ
jgi:spermidine synthase